MTAPLLIHVRPAARGGWTVHPEDRPEPISVHAGETEAEHAAFLLAAAHQGDARVVILDRYARPRPANLRSAHHQEPDGWPSTIPSRRSIARSL